MDGLQVKNDKNIRSLKKSIIEENTFETTKKFLVHPVKEVYVSKNVFDLDRTKQEMVRSLGRDFIEKRQKLSYGNC